MQGVKEFVGQPNNELSKTIARLFSKRVFSSVAKKQATSFSRKQDCCVQEKNLTEEKIRIKSD